MSPARDAKWCSSLAGKTIGGKWTLVSFVGAGRIGYVYRAQHKDYANASRAVKLIFDELKSGWEVELNKVLSLELVDGVVHFHESGPETVIHEGTTALCHYTVWDFIAPGENLHQYLRRVPSVSTSFLVAVIERILHVLHACEAQGVARHGDLHSGNILIGDNSLAKLDDSLQPRAPIYVSDFGYGATGGEQTPKDDYKGLARIINEMIPKVDYATATATNRKVLQGLQRDLGKLLREPAGPERRAPLDLLRVLAQIKHVAQAGDRQAFLGATATSVEIDMSASAGSHIAPARADTPSVGQFQVSEMIGDRWDWWKRLFVATVPARSKILRLDIPTVLTGPRGCGKTMLLRRLSERLTVECGQVSELSAAERFVAFYVNANDFADGFARFPHAPSEEDERRLTCYANLCVLADVLAVQSAREGLGEPASDALLALVQQWLIPASFSTLLVGEDRLERYRAVLEQRKWRFPAQIHDALFPGYAEMSQHRWLPRFIQQARSCCEWIGDRSVLLFIDDFSTPRVSPSMQRVLNRLFLQRSPEFLAKVATEAWSTFVPEDSTGKNLQDGDDYQLVDIGEEALFLADDERRAFLGEVFSRRLQVDPRLPSSAATLAGLLGRMNLSKTEFARRLRTSLRSQPTEEAVIVDTQRRGRSRARVYYYGEDVFSDLWSGDTRTMIQLVTDVIDQAFEAKAASQSNGGQAIEVPIEESMQDRVFRNRGGEWLNSHTRNEPTDPERLKSELARFSEEHPGFSLRGEYGDHLKAIVEAFVSAATALLLGPTYRIKEGDRYREVPRMAFRIEILDEFRVCALANEIYRDLIRYGLFMRDSRGKSVRGAFVPRLYLRRLLLPFSTLALSKRDSVPLTCAAFEKLLLQPDQFREDFLARRHRLKDQDDQIALLSDEGADAPFSGLSDPAYDDTDSAVEASPRRSRELSEPSSEDQK